MSETDLLEQALQLPPSSRATLVEKIVESIAADIDPAVERAHLDEIKLRRQKAASDPGSIVSGDEVLQHARSLLRK
jgi:putative addiction module component (TIGR02574 family)